MGKVVLNFRSLSFRDDPSLPGPSNYWRSFSDVSSQTGNLDHSHRYRFRSPIPEPIVDPPSPTSSGIGNTINMLTKIDFVIDWSTLKEDYYSQKNSALRKWFEVIDFDCREQIKKVWITDMERLNVSIPFFLWFPTFTSKFGLPAVYAQPSLNVQTTLLKVWHFVKGESVSSIHPPLADLTFLLEDVALNATPFRKGRKGDMAATYADIQKVHQQLNYTNSAISTIASQLNHVANRVDTPKTPIPSTSTTVETYANTISKPFFKVEGVSRKDQDDFTTAFSNTSLLKQISQQIKALDIQAPSTSCIDKTCSQFRQETSASETDEAEDDNESEEDTLNSLTKTFEEDKDLALNKINYGNKSTMRNYYTRPSPPDLQYEERGTFSMNHFDGQSIYTWDLDGKSEHEILNTLQEMTMAMTAYKTKGLDPRTQAIACINGFQGQLKYWWDNFLAEEEHTKILDYQRTWTDEDGMTRSEPAGAVMLIRTITLHFLGNPREEQAAAKSVLINLRCPTLPDYRWYKDVFLTNVLKREDGLANFWKECFIAGLPKLFGERILSKLRQNFATSDIPFNLLTFG